MFNIASTLLTFHRPRQLPTRRLPRIMPVAVSAEADVCKWDGAIHEISPINITNLLSTTRRILSVWMTSVVSPIRMPAGLPASRCRLVQHPCSHCAEQVKILELRQEQAPLPPRRRSLLLPQMHSV